MKSRMKDDCQMLLGLAFVVPVVSDWIRPPVLQYRPFKMDGERAVTNYDSWLRWATPLSEGRAQ